MGPEFESLRGHIDRRRKCVGGYFFVAAFKFNGLKAIA